VPAAPLDQAITERLVGAITQVTIELALAALPSLEERDREIGAQWRLRIERADLANGDPRAAGLCRRLSRRRSVPQSAGRTQSARIMRTLRRLPRSSIFTKVTACQKVKNPAN